MTFTCDPHGKSNGEMGHSKMMMMSISGFLNFGDIVFILYLALFVEIISMVLN